MTTQCCCVIWFSASFILLLNQLIFPDLHETCDDTELVQVTLLRRTLASSPNPSALVAFSKGIRAVKLCSNKILQFLTGVPANAGYPVQWLQSARCSRRNFMCLQLYIYDTFFVNKCFCSAMEALIRAKYEQKKYIDKDWVPPRPSVSHLSMMFAVLLIIYGHPM